MFSPNPAIDRPSERSAVIKDDRVVARAASDLRRAGADCDGRGPVRRRYGAVGVDGHVEIGAASKKIGLACRIRNRLLTSVLHERNCRAARTGYNTGNVADAQRPGRRPGGQVYIHASHIGGIVQGVRPSDTANDGPVQEVWRPSWKAEVLLPEPPMIFDAPAPVVRMMLPSVAETVPSVFTVTLRAALTAEEIQHAARIGCSILAPVLCENNFADAADAQRPGRRPGRKVYRHASREGGIIKGIRPPSADDLPVKARAVLKDKRILPSLILQSAAAQETAQMNAATPQLVIIDTDVGDDIDDVLAIGLAVSSPEVKILAINSAWGDTQKRTQLLDRLTREVGREEIPVGLGVRTQRNDAASFLRHGGLRGSR